MQMHDDCLDYTLTIQESHEGDYAARVDYTMPFGSLSFYRRASDPDVAARRAIDALDEKLIELGAPRFRLLAA